MHPARFHSPRGATVPGIGKRQQRRTRRKRDRGIKQAPFREFVEHGTFGTLDELDPPAWGPPEYDSYLVRTCHELRKKPLSQFTVEDLRIMIGQGIALDHLVPRALKILDVDPLAEGDFYPGDLLAAVSTGPDRSYWQLHPDQAKRLDDVIKEVETDDKHLRAAISTFLTTQT